MSKVLNKVGAPANWKAQLSELGIRQEPTSADYYELPEMRQLKKEDSRILMSENKKYLLELYSFETDGDWGGMNILAAYDTAHGAKLIDAVNVQEDRECWLFSPSTLQLCQGDQCLVVNNSHLNAGENYCALTLYSVRSGKIKPLCALPLLYSMNSGKLEVSREPHFINPNNSQNKMRQAIIFQINQVEKHLDEDSGKVLSQKAKSFNVQILPANGGKNYVVAKHDKGVNALAASDKRLQIGP